MPAVATQEWLSPAQAARRLGVTPERMRQLERSGRLPCWWTPLGRLFDLADVERLVAERERTDQGAAP
jgi:DNA-binding transcriptional MerR regulator